MKPSSATEAVEQLIHEYSTLVFHLIFGMTGDWAESEDLTQEVFLSAFRAIDAARAVSGEQFQAKAWLLQITLNTARMYRRRQRLVRFVHFSELETEDAGSESISADAAPVQPGGYGSLEGGDPAALIAERDVVRRSMAQLPEALRLPLLLSVVGGLSSSEIARILELGEVAVRQRLTRARKQFRALYAGESGEAVVETATAPKARSGTTQVGRHMGRANSPEWASMVS